MNSIDLSIFNWFQHFVGVRHWIDVFIIFKAEYLGWSIIVILVLIFFFQIKNEVKFHINWRMGWEALASGILSRFIFTEVIRFVWSRPRPFEVLQNIHQLVAHETRGSFPSGHAAFFFAVAMSAFFYRRTLGIIFFAIAIYMSTGRIEAGLHWPSDILVGALIGIFSAWLAHLLFKRFWNKTKTA